MNKDSMVKEICTDTKQMIYDFGEIHPKNYEVSQDGSFIVTVRGKLIFNFEKNELAIYVWEDDSL